MTDASAEPTDNPPDDTLEAALTRHGITLEDDQIAALQRYCAALWKWNERINLTRHTSYEKFVARDVVDCQALDPLIDAGQRVLDVGTGGGVPGAVVAILRPDLEVVLCDSMAKKAKAVQAIIADARLEIEVFHGRAEQLLVQREFDTLIARAVAPLAKLITWFKPHWDTFERLLVIKGPGWVEERRDARERGLLQGIELRKAAAYPLAGTHSESVVLSLRRKGNDFE